MCSIGRHNIRVFQLSSKAYGPRDLMKMGSACGRMAVAQSGKIETGMERSRLFSCLIWSVRDWTSKWAFLLPQWERR